MLMMLKSDALSLFFLVHALLLSVATTVGVRLPPSTPRIASAGGGTDHARRTSLVRRSLAGGLAGSFATLLLYPIDTVKTMRQSSTMNIQKALSTLRARGVMTVYSGLVPATVGSFASSALYFGSYETAKRLLLSSQALTSTLSRQSIHMLAAVSGNLASSFLFVPKDALKQQMQALRTGTLPALPGMVASAAPGRLARSAAPVSFAQVVRYIFRTKGLKGFYPSYRATLLRNIPSAVVRFTVYEELRVLVLRGGQGRWRDAGFFLIGGIASALSSAATTPLGYFLGCLPPLSPPFIHFTHTRPVGLVLFLPLLLLLLLCFLPLLLFYHSHPSPPPPPPPTPLLLFLLHQHTQHMKRRGQNPPGHRGNQAGHACAALPVGHIPLRGLARPLRGPP